MKRTLENNLTLYMQLIKVLLKSKLEYRFNFFMEVFINIFTYTVTYIGLWIMINKFENIQGWKFHELMLLYNFNLFSYGVACSLFYHPMRSIENLVHKGEFDGVLVKPLNPFIYILLRQGYFGFWGHIVLGIWVFIISFVKLEMTINLGILMSLVMKLIGSILIQSSIMIFTGALCFKFTRAISVMDVCIYKVREFINYPISIYSLGVQIFLTFVIPYGFVNFYPVEVLLGKQDNFLPIVFADAGGIILGIILFVVSYNFFTMYVNKYQSTGS